MKRKQHSLSPAFAAAALTLFISTAQSQSLPYYDVSVFQYAIFYNLNLEMDPGGPLAIGGPVFCNAGIWSGTPTVTYASTVEAVGQVSTNEDDPFVSNDFKSDAGTPQSSFLYPGQPVSGVAPVTNPSGDSSITNAEAFINLPPAGVRAPQTIAYEFMNSVYDFNDASLIVSNWYWGTNGVKPWSNNFTVYLQDSVTNPYFVQSNGVAMNWIQLTNDYYIVSNSYNGSSILFSTNYVPNFRFTNNASSIRWTNNPTGTNSVWYAGFSFLTNVSFYDFREQATVRAVQIDVGKLGAWITNWTPNSGSNWNQELAGDLGHGINSLFVYNAVPFIGQQQLPAVRLVNGQLLPSSKWYFDGLPEGFTVGLTVVTPQPLYVLGSYNVQIAGGSPLLGSHNTTQTYPAAFMADAITILSSNWSDTYNASTSLTSRISANATINAACLEGIVPSSGQNYSGGVESFLRFLENWDGYVLTYNGSFAAMFPCIYATNVWIEPGTGNVYNVPVRDWAFDTNFLTQSNLPPLTPLVIDSNTVPTIKVQPTTEAVLPGATTNFTVTASGVPAVGYQWFFNGTNISGATNDFLILNSVMFTNAGDYTVEVTNVLGSVVSSNAFLFIYTSTVPVMNALSFSASNGLQFAVSGVPGFSYIVEASTNLINWEPLATNNSPFGFADTNTVFPQRFYRSVYLP